MDHVSTQGAAHVTANRAATSRAVTAQETGADQPSLEENHVTQQAYASEMGRGDVWLTPLLGKASPRPVPTVPEVAHAAVVNSTALSLDDKALIERAAEAFYAQWCLTCERQGETWEPDADDFEFAIGALDLPDTHNMTVMVGVFSDAFDWSRSCDGGPRLCGRMAP